MKQWTITGTEKGFDGLEYGDVQVPAVGENEVLVKIGGASLNYRDLIIPKVTGSILRISIQETPLSYPAEHPNANIPLKRDSTHSPPNSPLQHARMAQVK